MKRILILFAAVSCLTSCTKTLYLGRTPQTHFSFPNANVSPLNKVRGESASKMKLFMPPFVNSKLINQAYADALTKASGSDGLINVDIYQKSTNLMILQFTKYIVEGTAVKQEIGRQKLQ